MEWNWKDGEPSMVLRENNGVPFLSFPALEETKIVANGFSTRLGGVSTGSFSSMNLSFSRGDEREHVLENYRRMAGALNVDPERMVVSYQTHTTNVRRVTQEDAGKGVFRERDYRDIDGLITNVPGITLVTFYADCVPLYFVDPVKKAIGLSHSGWRGTVSRMGAATVNEMTKAYGSRPSDLIACIGPSICVDCYEVGSEVAECFRKEFGPSNEDRLLIKKENGKYQLDLWAANRLVLEEAGLSPQQIHTTNVCTHCNPEYLFSHRSAGEKRGNLAAFLALTYKC